MEKNKTLTDYLSLIYKWKNFVIINILIITAAISVYAFLQPNRYRATATVMLPPESSLGGLSGLVSGKGAAGMGAKLLGLGGNTSEDMILGILNSRSSLIKVIDKFDLKNYYQIKDKDIDKTIKEFKTDISFAPNEFGMIDISILNKDPRVGAEISNFFVNLVDSASIALNIQHAKSNRSFIEKRYKESLSDLNLAEDSLYRFQKQYGVFALDQQLEAAVKSSAQLEGQITSLELVEHTVKQTYGDASPEYLRVNSEVKMLKDKVAELKNSDKIESSNVFLPFKKIPELSRDYLKIYRDLQTQKSILEVLLPLYEQAKIEEQKSIPTVMIIDKAEPSFLKAEPKRGVFIAGVSLVGLFFLIMTIFIGEGATAGKEFKNTIEEKNYIFFTMIKKMYRIKN